MSDYKIKRSRMTKGFLIDATIRKGKQEEKENRALDFFCSSLQKNNGNVEESVKETRERYKKIPIKLEETTQQPYIGGKAIRLRIG